VVRINVCYCRTDRIANKYFDHILQYNLTQLPQNGTFDTINVFPNTDKTYPMNLVKRRNRKQKQIARNLTEDFEAAGTSATEPMNTETNFVEDYEPGESSTYETVDKAANLFS